MVKRLPAAIAAALAALFAAADRPAEAHVSPTCIPLEMVPECSDGIDNDMDTRVDAADPECAGASDYSEAFVGRQGPPCERIDLSLWAQILWVVPWPDCPECGLTLVDLRDLLTTPVDELIQQVHPDWAVSVAMKLDKPIPNVFDDPAIPNLRFRYVGNKVIGPGNLGPLVLFADPTPTTAIRYVGQAFDKNTRKLVTNIGTLSAQ